MKKTILILMLGLLFATMASADKFQCTQDCPPPQSGYRLIGCTTTKNYAVTHEEGSHVPMKGPDVGVGYVEIKSYTEKDDEGNVIVDEIIACDYWPVDKELPPEE
ncbi:hypothetical protein KY312_03285, partial [Candidatus Woesearchaeota archaeon]|nr:hypothetical protein [Candidatus Woesearchaeota archaeon]